MNDAGERPFFTGLIVYRNPKYGYSLFYPEGWHRVELAVEDGQGVAFAPVAGYLVTSLMIEARHLGTTVTAADLPALRQGFLAGLRKLRRSTVEHQEDYAIGDLVGFEARHTFQEGSTRRKRWVRLLYQRSTQVCLIAQGATVKDFDYWLPMFFQSMRTFRFGDWWADITGHEWLPTLDSAASFERERRATPGEPT